MSVVNHTPLTKTTHWKAVIPFYGYGAIALLVSTVLLLLSANNLLIHYFSPGNLAITHLMALGWGTMMILGASHQLIPVLIESELYSIKLAMLTFLLAGIGIPLLVVGFYEFNMGAPAKWGGRLIVLSVIVYLYNLFKSIKNSKKENVHALFLFTATAWLLVTSTLGLMLVYNFSFPLFQKNSVDYLPLHAHVGIVGWFLLTIIGVGSKLIPMFLISKYFNAKSLWRIYGLVNIGLILFVLLFLYSESLMVLFIPVLCILAAILLFIDYCYMAYKQRIKLRVDEPMKISLLAIMLNLLPVLLLLLIMSLVAFSNRVSISVVMGYGFIIFFGWITAILFGMTFKTLPFIVWNRAFQHQNQIAVTINPKDLYSKMIYKWMILFYWTGFLIFFTGLLINIVLLLSIGSGLLLLAALFYCLNIIRLILFKAPRDEHNNK
ncbi:cytochrome c oxidase subunit I [Sediminibacterium salmoneum]|uniref:cytochrome c oxidase subunit I n=1 Tax=Sediminibacterium salmoneum TaxID=426421 RepID=UPI00047C9888|nr:cytochrome c oxidase subunit I [Sediminibacterium salmoneum]